MLVIGPKGTPYAGGLFFFDINLPLTYPTHSPSFVLTTTFRRPISFDLEHGSSVVAPFLRNWTGIEKWSLGRSLVGEDSNEVENIVIPSPSPSPSPTLIDAIISVRSKESLSQSL
jgi:hypothetical protein